MANTFCAPCGVLSAQFPRKSRKSMASSCAKMLFPSRISSLFVACGCLICTCQKKGQRSYTAIRLDSYTARPRVCALCERGVCRRCRRCGRDHYRGYCRSCRSAKLRAQLQLAQQAQQAQRALPYCESCGPVFASVAVLRLAGRCIGAKERCCCCSLCKAIFFSD